MKRIEELEKGSKKSELDIFLKDKELSDEDKKSFDEMVKKWYDKEHAYQLATLEAQKATQNQKEIANNTLDGEDEVNPWKNKITMEELAELEQDQYNKTMDQVDAWKIEVVEKKE